MLVLDAVWRGLSTLAGSWIGGGANQTAMLEIYKYNPAKYGGMIFVDIVVANIWMALLLIGIGKSDKINKWLKADTTAIETLKDKLSNFTESVKRTPTLNDIMIMVGIAFGSVSFAHLCSGFLAPFFSDYVATINSETSRNIFTFLGSLMVQSDLCKQTLLSSWEALQMRAGAGAPPPASFSDYVISYIGETIADATENSIWLGNDATAGEFTGFVTGGAVGRLVQAGNTVVDVANVGGAGTRQSLLQHFIHH